MSFDFVPGTALVDGRYTLLSRLGEGGMASVWAARTNDPNLPEEIVLKILRHEIQKDEDRREMFLEEARLSAQLHHPYIVEIYAVEHWQALDILLMERIWGRPLDLLIAQTNRTKQSIPWPIAVKLVAMACEALHYANVTATADGRPLHLVHRDLKPANLIFTTEGTLKVIDFGIAKASTSQIKTRTGLVKGTVAYMSPEQLHAETLDIRSDLHSLGVVLYQLCTGQRPFAGENVTALILKILNEPPPPIQERAPHLPTALIKLIEQLLEKDKARRPPSALALQLALEEILRKHSSPVRQQDLQRYARQQFPDLFQEWEARFPGQSSTNETAPELPSLPWTGTPDTPVPFVDSEDTLPQRSPTKFLENAHQLAHLPAYAPTLSPDDTPPDINVLAHERKQHPVAAEASPLWHTMEHGGGGTPSTDDTLTAPPTPPPGKPGPALTLPEDAVPQFFRVDTGLAQLPANVTLPADEASRWVHEETPAWDDDEDETVYQRSAATGSELSLGKSLNTPDEEDTTLRDKANTPVPDTHPSAPPAIPETQHAATQHAAALATLSADDAKHTALPDDDDATVLESSRAVVPKLSAHPAQFSTGAATPSSTQTTLWSVLALLFGLGLAALLWWFFF